MLRGMTMVYSTTWMERRVVAGPHRMSGTLLPLASAHIGDRHDQTVPERPERSGDLRVAPRSLGGQVGFGGWAYLWRTELEYAGDPSSNLEENWSPPLKSSLILAKAARGSYSAGLSVGGSHAPVVKSWRRVSSLSSPHLVAVSR